MDEYDVAAAIKTLNAKHHQCSEIKEQAKILIKSVTDAIHKLTNTKLISILGSGETWIEFKYCERAFLIRCLWNYKSVEGSIEWLELVREPDESEFEAEVLNTSSFDHLGNIEKSSTTYEYGGLFFLMLIRILESTQAKYFPLEPVKLL